MEEKDYSKGMKLDSCLFIAVLVVATIVAIPVYLIYSGNSEKPEESEAWFTTKNFVTQNLKSPTTAEFPNYYSDSTEISITQNDDCYTISSYVYSNNSFGSPVKSRFRCTVRMTSKYNWELVDLLMY